MKYAFAAVALAAVARAQSFSDIPECAVPCLTDAIASETDCGADEFPCICANFEDIQGVATGCVLEECGAEVALNEVLPAVEGLCESVGDAPAPTTSAAEAEPTEEPIEEEPIEEEPIDMPTFAPTPAPLPSPTTTPSYTVIQPTPTPTSPETVPSAAAAAFGPLGALAVAAIGVLAL